MKPLKCPAAVALELDVGAFKPDATVSRVAEMLQGKGLAPDRDTALLWIGWWACDRDLKDAIAKQAHPMPLSPAAPQPERTWPAFDFWCEAFLTSLRGLIDPVLHAQMGVDAVHQARKMADEAVGLYFNAEAQGIAEIAEAVKAANDPANKRSR